MTYIHTEVSLLTAYYSGLLYWLINYIQLYYPLETEFNVSLYKNLKIVLKTCFLSTQNFGLIKK